MDSRVDLSLQDETIKNLVQQGQQGDRQAFGKVYEILAEPVYRYIYVRVLHHEVAEDLLSLTFLKAWNKLPKYEIRTDIKFSTWLFKVSRNVLADYWRSHKWEVNFEEFMRKTSSNENVERQVEQVFNGQKLLEALNKLSKLHQEVLTLRFINQFSVVETARVLDKSSDAVRSLQLRAMKALRQLIQ